ncbi:MAG: S10 family peptidase [Acidimicrobiales bacterium]|jgi:carboxypeptidase C (cathepsin A)
MPDETPEGSSTPATAPTPSDDVVTTRHELVTATGPMPYTASAGRVVLREETYEDGVFRGPKAKAEVFVVSYVADRTDDTPRPVTFAFNGGPGSSSVWLHLGLLGPRRVMMGDAGALAPPPYGLTDNTETLLAHSDLVFIDPVSTGYSRVVEGDKAADFHGYLRDLESIGEVIRLWTSRQDRWLSPKYLIGESYGTLRAAALTDHLQTRYGFALNGVMLISSVLDIGTLDDESEGNDLAFVLSLPTFTCLAHYHGLLGDRSLEQVRAEAETFALGDYARALLLGRRLPDDERAAVVTQLASLTGLDPGWLERADLRIEAHRFFRQLLRERGQVIGRLDGRFTGFEADAVGERLTADPSYSAIHGPYSAAFNHYVRAELEYVNDLPYEILTDRVRPWSFKEFEGRQVTVADRLAAAMRANEALRVHIAAGYYDGATPYFAAEHTLQHLHLPPERRGNLSFHYYDAGHMMYVHEESRLRQSEDLAAFVS